MCVPVYNMIYIYRYKRLKKILDFNVATLLSCMVSSYWLLITKFYCLYLQLTIMLYEIPLSYFPKYAIVSQFFLMRAN